MLGLIGTRRLLVFEEGNPTAAFSSGVAIQYWYLAATRKKF
jgi:hypothetical protein